MLGLAILNHQMLMRLSFMGHREASKPGVRGIRRERTVRRGGPQVAEAGAPPLRRLFQTIHRRRVRAPDNVLPHRRNLPGEPDEDAGVDVAPISLSSPGSNRRWKA